MKVSIILASFNSARTIERALQSIAEQSYPHVELIVIDGASEDGTLAILGRYRHAIDILVSELDSGLYDALNKGVSRATGDVLGFVHSDDFLADHRVITDIVDAFLSDSKVQAVYGDLKYVSSTKTPDIVRHWTAGLFSPGKLERGWMPPHPTLYVKTAKFREVGAFDTSFRVSADYDFCLRLFSNLGGDFVYIPRVLYFMRVGGASNGSLAKLALKASEDIAVLKKNRIGGVFIVLRKILSKVHQYF